MFAWPRVGRILVSGVVDIQRNGLFGGLRVWLLPTAQEVLSIMLRPASLRQALWPVLFGIAVSVYRLICIVRLCGDIIAVPR